LKNVVINGRIFTSTLVTVVAKIAPRIRRVTERDTRTDMQADRQTDRYRRINADIRLMHFLPVCQATAT